MSHQDLKPQVFNFGAKRPGSANTGPKKVTEAQAARIAQSGGQIDVSKKMSAGNKHNDLGARAKHLDDDHESTRVKLVDHGVRVNIQRGRQLKGWTQKDLATHINEKPSVVSDYENGKAVPNEGVLNRMEKALGMHLRGVKAGQPMETAKKPAPKAAAAPAA